jgi:hypothetical protein
MGMCVQIVRKPNPANLNPTKTNADRIRLGSANFSSGIGLDLKFENKSNLVLHCNLVFKFQFCPNFK